MNLSGMNIIDLAVFAIILFSGLLALMRGLVREVLSLGAWAGAIMATVYLYPTLRPWMHQHIHTASMADAATVITLFCVALAILIPAGFFLAGLVRGRALTAIDRSLGFIFGLLRGAAVVCILFLLSLWVWPDKVSEPGPLADARTRPFLVYGAEMMKVFLPKEDIQKVDENMRAFNGHAKAVTLDQMTTPTVGNGAPAPASTVTDQPNNPAPAPPPPAKP